MPIGGNGESDIEGAKRTMIRMKNVSKSFRSDLLRRKRIALRGMNLHVRRGETYALLGANGAGKTTTMKLLLDLIRPDEGEIRVDGIESHRSRCRLRLGYIPERPYFFPHLTGEELVLYYAALSGVERRLARVRCDKLLESLGLAGAASKKTRSYSKGMLQRLAFAQLLVGRPEILILDEPLSGLDPVGRREIRDILLREKERGSTILISSHILEDVEKVCDRAGFLVDGGIRNEVDSSGTEVLEVEATGIAAEELEAAKLVVEQIARVGERTRFRLGDEKELEKMNEVVRNHGGEIVSVNRHARSLEKLFVENVSSREVNR